MRFEVGFDDFHVNKEKIYRIVTDFERGEGMSHNPGAPVPMHDALKTDLSDLEEIGMIQFQGESQITLSENESLKYMEEDIGFVNQDYLDIFLFEFVAGKREQALDAPHQIVLTESLANKYFNDAESALGKVVRLNNQYDLKVTGVVKDLPANTDFSLNAMASLLTKKAKLEENGGWGSVSSSIQHFVLMPERANIQSYQSRLAEIVRKYQSERDIGKVTFYFQPLTEVHFDTRYGNFNDRVSGKETIWALVAIGVFILITACINFINLATAQAIKRAKEVGIRKVLGSSRSQLSYQFLGETALITLFSILLSIGLVELILPRINQVLDLRLTFALQGNPAMMVFLLVLFAFVSFFSGLYPSIVLSGFNPVEAIKHKIGAKHAGGYGLRRSLVVLQFVISQVLIIGTIIITSQLKYFQSKDLGFNREAILTIPLPENDQFSLSSFKEALRKIQGVAMVTFENSTPSSGDRWVSDIDMVGLDVQEVYVDQKIADENYVDTYQLTLVAGRNYKQSDTVSEVVVNEALLRKFGIKPEEAIGREVRFGGDFPVPIVGVIKDFHALSLREEISPILISTDRDSYSEAGIKISSENISQTIKEVEAAWSEVYPAYVFDFEFLDERIGGFYERETRLGQLFQIFAGIAIFIGCLGLYGLVSFMANQKTKEIGIRKVMGASISSILLLFSKEFMRLIFVAFLIAAPIAYFVMDSWLQDFTYKQSWPWRVFSCCDYFFVDSSCYRGVQGFKSVASKPDPIT